MSANTNEKTNANASGRNGKSTKMTAKRIAAIIGIILLLALYVTTLIVAIFDRSSSGQWFMLCLIGTVTIPLLIWIYTWMYGVLTQKHTIASLDLKENASENKTGEASDQE
ncbi:MAG: hypothetical protein K6F51_11835 [Acetatifactor sp.]|nr:hypothetical protein [Acetatifactor sp.]